MPEMSKLFQSAALNKQNYQLLRWERIIREIVFTVRSMLEDVSKMSDQRKKAYVNGISGIFGLWKMSFLARYRAFER